ncbi:metallophosphoesterase family protein [Tunturibacter empetritectus]|uniref:3',5'-cyclic AMP phosphodiesterase CpdA n=1 Tax=Tunturiibacter empetritectus TaxID=3069691 RepID=A0A7W8IKX4_9BACT|nr:metallophosphoesterase [Edaphobacter lichenicola]MBB5318982.1 3',5'-cyclic AMP phosphodiesterase CpdA [Edaphobacter lichenicola]
MNSTSRRQFLAMLGATGLSAAVAPSFLAASAPAGPVQEPFTFLFVTDAHLQPELNGVVGTDMAFKKARAVKADFAINGGDHVFDALGVPKQRALTLFDLYDKTEQDLGVKVYHTVGNHDVLGIYPASGIAQDDPLYGKKLFEQRFGKLYYSFDHKGHHFIVLDSIGITPDRAYEGRIDAAQLQWLAADLAALPVGAPVIVSIHIPLVTAIAAYMPEPAVAPAHHGLSVANANQVLDLFAGHNVLGVLQGHTHVNEVVEWKGVPYITSGAVCGNWWHGTRLGTPEGFTVVTVADNKLTTHYEPSGFQSVAPQNT